MDTILDALYKFRAKDKRGNVFYGSYNPDTDTIDDWEYAACHAVERDTVTRFAFFDKNGKEVYEDDFVIDEHGKEYRVELKPALIDGNTFTCRITSQIMLKE